MDPKFGVSPTSLHNVIHYFGPNLITISVAISTKAYKIYEHPYLINCLHECIFQDFRSPTLPVTLSCHPMQFFFPAKREMIIVHPL